MAGRKQRTTVKFDRPMLERLKKAKQEAEQAGQQQFTFEGNDYLVAYAKYLIEYLDKALPRE